MPYSSIAELPDYVKKLPVEKQKQWMNVFNSAMKSGDPEGVAFKKANGVVKASEDPWEFMAQGQPRDAAGRWTLSGWTDAEISADAAHSAEVLGGGWAQSPQGQQAVEYYTAEGYWEVNDGLRGGRPVEWGAEGSYEDTVNGMDGDLYSNSIKGDVVLWRGLGTEIGLEVGSVFSDEAYMSTTHDPAVAKTFSQNGPTPILVRMEVPEGTHAIPGSRRESEIILDRDLKFEVTDKGVWESSGVEYTVYNVKVME